MNAEDMKDLIDSLAWFSWSNYHNRNVLDILHKNFPGVNFSEELKKFEEVIVSKPGPGSPK